MNKNIFSVNQYQQKSLVAQLARYLRPSLKNIMDMKLNN